MIIKTVITAWYQMRLKHLININEPMNRAEEKSVNKKIYDLHLKLNRIEDY